MKKKANDSLSNDSLLDCSARPDRAAVESYLRMYPDNTVNADRAKFLFNGYNTREIDNERRYFGGSAELAGMVYDILIESERGSGNNTVLFTAGGNGSGKSTVANALAQAESYPIILDSTLSSSEWSQKQIAQALNAGYHVQVICVVRDPVDAWENGIWQRYEAGGHFVPLDTFLSTHRAARRNVLELANKYGSTVDFILLASSSRQHSRVMSLDELSNEPYNEETIREKINEISREKLKQFPHVPRAAAIK